MYTFVGFIWVFGHICIYTYIQVYITYIYTRMDLYVRVRQAPRPGLGGFNLSPRTFLNVFEFESNLKACSAASLHSSKQPSISADEPLL